MDHWLDDVARSVARGESRRRAILKIGGGLFGATLAMFVGREVASAQATCGPLQTRCGSTCVNIRNDESNCGGCGRVCLSGQTCTNGACACPAGQVVCSGVCVNLLSNPNNCGGCGKQCTASGQICQQGACKCSDTLQSVCSNVCVNVRTDVNNCGSCNRHCASNETCRNGGCVPRQGGTGASTRGSGLKATLDETGSF